MNSRMYDPKTARFMQEDSYTGYFNDPLSLNLYIYCHNELVMYIDPTGHLNVGISWVIDGPTTNTSENIKKQMEEEKNPKEKGHLKDLYNYYAVSEEAYEDYEINETERMILSAFEDMVEGKLDKNTLIRGRAYGPMYILFHEEAQGKEYWEMTPKEIRDHHKVVQARLDGIEAYAKNLDIFKIDFSKYNGEDLYYFYQGYKDGPSIQGAKGTMAFLAYLDAFAGFVPNYFMFCDETGAILKGKIQGIFNMGTKPQVEVAVTQLSGKVLSGNWIKVNKSMSDSSRAYQKQITGREGEVWLQNGVKFGGMKDGVLLEAKGKYAQFVDNNTGEYYSWFKGKQSLIDEARRQINASEGATIHWYFAEESAMNATKSLFADEGIKGIQFNFQPMK